MEDTNIDKLIAIMNSRTAYILGFIWGDGCVRIPKRCKNYLLSIGLKYDDYEYLKPILDDFRFEKRWKHGINEYREDYCQKGILHKTSKSQRGRIFGDIANTLGALDYPIKSGGSPKKVLDLIPEPLKRYFWLGLVDADGCFYVAKSSNCFSIGSTFDQDWDEYIAFLESIGINGWKINRRTFPSGSSGSDITIRNLPEIKILGSLLYKTFENDNIGLKRKYEKYKIMEERSIGISPKSCSIKGICKKKNGKWTAWIVYKKRNRYLGAFDNQEDALKIREYNEECLSRSENNGGLFIPQRYEYIIIRNDGKIYMSTKDAAKDSETSESCINKVIRGKSKHANKYTFIRSEILVDIT